MLESVVPRWTRRWIVLSAVLSLCHSAAAAPNDSPLAPGTVDPVFGPITVDNEIDAMVADENGRVLIAGAFTNVNGIVSLSLARLEAGGVLDPTFAPAIGPSAEPPTTVRSIARLADGRIYIEGNFNQVSGQPRNGLARLNENGSLDETFTPAVPGSFGWFALQPDGKVLTSSQPIVRLKRDGSLDPTWRPYWSSNPVRAPIRIKGAVQEDGKLIVAIDNGFSMFPQIPGGISLLRLAEDGTLDPSYHGFSSSYSGMMPQSPWVLPDGKILFFNVGSIFIPGLPLARFDLTGPQDPAFRGVLPALQIRSLAVDELQRPIIGGDFLQIDGQARPNLARLTPDGALDTNFVPAVSWASAPTALAVQPTGDILAGGAFQTDTGDLGWRVLRLAGDRQTAAPRILRQPASVSVLAGEPAGLAICVAGYPQPQFQWQLNGIDLLGATNATLTWPQTTLANDAKYTVNVQNSAGQVQSAEARLHVLLPSLPSIISQPSPQTVNAGDIVTFSVTATNIQDLYYQWSLGSVPLPSGTNATLALTNVLPAQAGIYTVAVSNLTGTVTSEPALLTVRSHSLTPGELDPTFFVSSVPPAPDSSDVGYTGTFVVAAPDGRVYINIGREVLRVRSTGERDGSFAPATVMNGPTARGAFGTQIDFTSLDSLVLSRDGKLLLRGIFGAVNQKSHHQLARLDADGTVDESFQPDPGALSYNISFGIIGPYVHELRELAGGGLAVAGTFAQLNGGVPRAIVAKLTPSGAVDLSFDASTALAAFTNQVYSVTALLPLPDGRLVCAGFVPFPGVNPVFQLTGDGSLDTEFDPTTSNGRVIAMAQAVDGKIWVGGAFSSFDGEARTNLARLSPNGNIDPTAAPSAPDGVVTSILPQADGKTVIAGEFTHVGTILRNRIARLNGDGSLDLSFDPGAGPDARITSVARQADGNLVIGGSFGKIGDVVRHRVARLSGGELPAPPAVQIQSESGQVYAGQEVVLRVWASSYVVPQFQWQWNGQDIPGATNAGLSIANINSSQAGSYTARVTNPAGSQTARPIELSVVMPNGPVIVSQPSDAAAFAGQTVTFSVKAESPLPVVYQWRHDGITIPGATNSVLRLDSIGVANAGTYSVEVAHTLARTDSRPALLTVDAGLRAGLPNLVLDLSIAPITLDASSGFMTTEVDSQNRILVGGRITLRRDGSSAILVRLTPDGRLDDTFRMPRADTIDVPRDILVLPNDGVLFTLAYDFGLVQLLQDGSADAGFTPPTFGGIPPMLRSLARQSDGQLLIGGSFSEVDGQSREGVARLRSTGPVDPQFVPKFPIPEGITAVRESSLVVLQPDQKALVWSAWSGPGAHAPHESTIVRLTPEGSRDLTFALGPELLQGEQVTEIALQSDGKIIVARRGGGSLPLHNLMRLTSTGQLDASFHPAFSQAESQGPEVYAVVVQADDKIVLGGSFSAIDGISRRNIARLNADGTVDETFAPEGGPNGLVLDLALVPNGDVVAVGQFTSFNEVPCPGIIRLYGGNLGAPGPHLRASRWNAGTFAFQFETVLGQTYTPEFQEAGQASWHPLAPSTGTGIVVDAADLGATNGSRVYRVRVEASSAAKP